MRHGARPGGGHDARRLPARGPGGVPEALLALLAALGLLGLAWLALGVVLEGLARVPGTVGAAAARASAALSPVVVRRVAAVVLGVGVGASGLGAGTAVAGPARVVGTAVAGAVAFEAAPATGASGGPAGSADAPLPDPGWSPAPDPGWTPSAPTVRRQPDVSVVSGRGAAPAVDDEVVVHRGDSLWSIAARHLGPGATDAEVARAWPHWYAENHDVVGPDPDRLLPGQVLRVPTVVGS
ncbi:LysM peptidoglycan-binding domain-containing protein [Phycicoccus sp. HDW14]|uniref:LysM peptidoglycan-binding domain-containing protein n=1 Tax=Phycicoccus sp. HDW14 TaxID=2714941 RepID=UPI001408DAA4|nr:LysM peptidoglycan-binding domain-containing protein [Phycicoccus sp. HDW14]QIM21402.1 LysM peptidoglycan-binding domain-containing protein [Phycicoccus sp. HDW14]